MIVELDNLAQIRAAHTEASIAFRTGCYDIVHEGHLAGLEQAKEHGDVLVVGVWPDGHVRARKGQGRPIMPEQSRLKLISALAIVDYALVMPEYDDVSPHPTLQVVSKLRPDVVMFPRRESGRPPHRNDELLGLMGVQIVYDTTPALNSTTSIIGRIVRRYGEVPA